MPSKKSILIAHPYVHPSGGGNLVAAWAIQALCHSYDLSVATLGPIDFDAVNRNFGTSLTPADFTLCVAPESFQRILRRMPTPGALLHICLTMRLAQDLDRLHPFDLLFSTQNEADFGRPGLQYVHYPWVYLPRPEVEFAWYHYIPGALWAYRRACQSLARASNDGLRRNLSLANSEFVAGRIRDVHGTSSVVLHPPVPGAFCDTPWSERTAGFVAVGRIHTGKRWEMAVEILDRVRDGGHDVGLTLIGHRDDEPCHRRLQALAATRPWFRMLHDLDREGLAAEVSRHRYAIHTMHEEHFGIAPAETQRAGCITFVHNSGGPIEIVGGHPLLVFDEVEDAAAKIRRMLADRAVEDQLRAHVAQQRQRFTAERFCESLREIVAGLVK
jgi:glycosyltransferase involved in cell wall biosynthesis